MTDLVKSVLDKMSSINKPQKDFIALLLSTLAVVQGKANFRNMARYCIANEKRFSRWFRRSFNFTRFNELLIFQQLPKNTECIAAMDASFLSKSGNKTDGLGNFFHGAIGKAEKGLEVTLVSAVNLHSNTAYALDVMQTIDAEVESEVDAKNKPSRVDFYAKQAVRVAPILLEHHIRYMAVDALYTKRKFVKPVTKAGIELVGKLRCDANLRWLYSGQQLGRGRPKRFDGKIDFNNEIHRFEYDGKLDDETEVYSTVAHSVCLERNIKVVMLIGNRKGKVFRALLFSSDCELDAMTLVAYYKSRFQIEFIFRDAKQYTGLMDCQARKKEAIHTHINAAFTALNILKFEDAEAKNTTDETVISIASWKRRKFNQHLINVIFSKLGIDLSDKKVSQVYDEVSEYGTIAA